MSGYCYVDNANKTCVCPVGFSGQLCEQSKLHCILQSHLINRIFSRAWKFVIDMGSPKYCRIIILPGQEANGMIKECLFDHL